MEKQISAVCDVEFDVVADLAGLLAAIGCKLPVALFALMEQLQPATVLTFSASAVTEIAK